jgi:hypothetical protein
MNDLLGFFTVMGVMFTSDRPVTGPIPCEKQITASLSKLVAEDENNRVGENISVEKREAGVQSYNFSYRVRKNDGTEHLHAYHVETSQDCKSIQVKRI